ncbi:MAG: ATPase, T2SS/T4P/T4SS family [Candidatus Omnitrophica bacterium]|nr:ATPase, T2SS/T4P/T4SS family [Candidatus Omnitrophota bacterium]
MRSLKDRLTEIFINNKLITSAQLGRALKEQEAKGGNLSDIIVKLKFIKQRQLSDILNQELGLPLFDLKCFDIDPDSIKIIPVEIARRYQIIPLFITGSSLTLAMADPLNLLPVYSLPEFRGLKINPVIFSFQDISQAIVLYYTPCAEIDIDHLAQKMSSSIEIIRQEKNASFSAQELERMSQEVPAIKTTNVILEQAVKKNASEVLVEPLEKKLRLRFRIDGLFQEQEVLSRDMHVQILSRLKVISGLGISGQGLPQDGRFKANLLGRQVDFNISILPTIFGEKAALRRLDKTQVNLDIKELGLSDYTMRVLTRGSSFNHGLILVCGPDGSGKTTTLYAVLKSLNSLDKNIITIENPVEIQLEGVNQVAVSPEIGFSFAAGLRSAQLQDPNIIMISEIPDYETVDMAIKSALTGHLVFSSLNSPTAASAIAHLINMGVAPYLINSSLICVIAQRLLKKVCPYCKEAYSLNKNAAEKLRLDTARIAKPQFYRGKGCRSCLNTGYSGKMVITEALQFSRKMHDLVLGRAGERFIKQQAQLEGMRSLRQAGLDAALSGQTSIEEVLLVSEPDD